MDVIEPTVSAGHRSPKDAAETTPLFRRVKMGVLSRGPRAGSASSASSGGPIPKRGSSEGWPALFFHSVTTQKT